MLVVATMGHVDHGKSALVRALTGMEPDRLAEERRRGMSLDLGFAWSDELSFVDVPGHERLLDTMLAGLGPASAALLVVAADEGWRAQTEEHVRAFEMLGGSELVVAVTRADLADPGSAIAQCRARLGDHVDVVAVSSVTGLGVKAVRDALLGLIRAQGAAPPDRARLWVDRVFSVDGAGTVVTGTLVGGALGRGDQVTAGVVDSVVRSLQTCGRDVDVAAPGTRVAVALRGVDRDSLRRGDVVVHRGRWEPARVVDVELLQPGRLPREAFLHIGSARLPVHFRALADDLARLTAARPLTVQVGDRGVLRAPGGRLLSGVVVLEPHAPPLIRRGAAASHAVALRTTTVLQRRGAARTAHLERIGVASETAVVVGEWSVDPATWHTWRDGVRALVADADVSHGHVATTLGLPDPGLVPALAAAADLVDRGGRVGLRDRGLPTAIEELVQCLSRHPFDPAAASLDPTTAADAARRGLLVDLGDGVHLLPDALERAEALLRAIEPPFSVGDVRDALQTSRRVAVPVLARLDQTGVTRRLPDGTRVLAQSA